MPRLIEIVKAMQKLDSKGNSGEEIEGNIKYINDRGKENRYSYYFKNKLVFTFGITRGKGQKDENYGYVPRQIGINNGEFERLHICTMSKEEYNKSLKESGKIIDDENKLENIVEKPKKKKSKKMDNY